MRLTLFFRAALLSCVWVAGASANAELYAPCASCHGEQAQGQRALAAPRLNHLDPVSLLLQLEKFQRGWRGGEGASAAAKQMAGSVALLPPEAAWPELVAWIADQDSDVSPVTVTGDRERGGTLYRQFCAACHGPRAQGNLALNAPRLAGGDDWYLLAQLHAFREGQRGRLREDRAGRQMRSMAAALPDDAALADIVSWIRAQSE